MITGFNTDIQHGGVTYHVQTEDKGLDSPLILSLVYVGGRIIASKRTPYEDLVGRGFDEKALTERLQRQHKLICAAIKAGRVNDLKRMAAPPAPTDAPANGIPAQADGQIVKGGEGQGAEPSLAADAKGHAAAPVAAESPVPPREEPAPPLAEPVAVKADEPPASPAEAVQAEPEIVILTTRAEEVSALGGLPAGHEPKPFAPPTAETFVQAQILTPDGVPVGAVDVPLLEAEILDSPEEAAEELYLGLLDDEGEFRAGQLVTIKVYVGRGTYGQRPEPLAAVTVKVLGTSFRPLIMTAETDGQGIGVVRALLPRFNSGRAAIIIRAVSGDDSVEMRRIIHQ